MAPSEPALPNLTPVLTRSTPDKEAASAAAPASGSWSRARQWFGRLLGRPAAKPARKTSRTSTLDKAELEKVRLHLSEVLDQHPQAREVMKYVRALEHGLQKKGRFALDDLPVDVIRRALEQLDPLVTDWSLEGLSTLRSKAAVAIAGRERVEAERAERRASNETDVEVEEASVTTFMQANEEWERSFTNSAPTPLDDPTADPNKPDKPDKPRS